MKLGLKRNTVSLCEYDPLWADTASKTIQLLKSILGDSASDIQHIGSTAIYGIFSKPIIDIVVGVSDFDSVLAKNKELEKHGIIYRKQDYPNQLLYVIGDFSEDTRTHHIHIVYYGKTEWNNYIRFRDYLNSHKADAEAYSKLKLELSLEYKNDRAAYTKAKQRFIENILKKAETAENNL